MAQGGETLDLDPKGNEKLCAVCRQDNNHEVASCYCKQCRQLLCKQCENYHRKLAISKAHELIHTGDSVLGNGATKAEVSDEVRAPICSTHCQPFEFYCTEHNAPVCGSCKLLDHRKCSNLQDLEIAAQHNDEIYHEVLAHLKAINSAIDDVKHDIEKEEDTLETHRDKAIEKIENKIKEIESAGQKQISEVKTIFKEEDMLLDRDKKVVIDSQQLILKKIKELELTSMSCSPEETFLAAKSACRETGKFYDILCESSHIKHTKIDFNVDSKLEEIVSVGEILLEKNNSNTDYHHHLVHVMDLDEADSFVMQMEILPSKQILFLTVRLRGENSSLLLYSSSKQCLSHLDIPQNPCVAVNDHQIMIPKKEETGLQLININKNELSLGEHKETEVEHLLASKGSAESILMLNKGKQESCTLVCTILKSNTDIKTEIYINVEESINIHQISNMTINKKQDIVYILGVDKGCYGFNLKGECLFHFEQEGCNCYVGLVVDQDDNIYITCATEEKKEEREEDEDIRSHIVQLSPTGVFQKQVLVAPTLVAPIMYCENKLYIATLELNQEKKFTSVYQLYT